MRRFREDEEFIPALYLFTQCLKSLREVCTPGNYFNKIINTCMCKCGWPPVTALEGKCSGFPGTMEAESYL